MELQMKRTVCFACSAIVVASAGAAMLDLAGTDMTVSDVTTLASYDGVTNSSATAATLTFNIADDQAYGMTIGGKVAVVKAGAGTLSLGKADRTFTGGTTVSQGKLVLATDNANALARGERRHAVYGRKGYLAACSCRRRQDAEVRPCARHADSAEVVLPIRA